MCVILVAHTKRPTLDILRDCEKANGDGAGISWIVDNHVRWAKGLTAKEIDEIQATLPLPYVIHFRWATVGKSKEFCHPFPIDGFSGTEMEGEARSVLFHNGHITGYEGILNLMSSKWGYLRKLGTFSDSRVAAIAAYHMGLDSLLYAFDTQKFCVLNRGGPVIYGNGWEQEGGIYYSNFNWKRYYTPTPYNPPAYSHGGGWGEGTGDLWKDDAPKVKKSGIKLIRDIVKSKTRDIQAVRVMMPNSFETSPVSPEGGDLFDFILKNPGRVYLTPPTDLQNPQYWGCLQNMEEGDVSLVKLQDHADAQPEEYLLYCNKGAIKTCRLSARRKGLNQKEVDRHCGP
jgi:hypothetical protein